MIGALALGAAVLPWPATAQGVPIVDPKSIIQHGLEIAQMSYLTGGRELEADKKRRIDELHQDQLDALDATLAMMTGKTPWIGDLEVIPGAEAEVLYAVEDNNPYAARLFGDAKTSIEEMIVATAQKYAGHPGLARAGLNPVEFRIWFQSLVKQESGFSIGARSPVGAFGLTQVMPDTARRFGVDSDRWMSVEAKLADPKINVGIGARYLRLLLDMFPGRTDLALASYNAGEGAVQRAGNKVPNYKETQNYVATVTELYAALKPPAPAKPPTPQAAGGKPVLNPYGDGYVLSGSRTAYVLAPGTMPGGAIGRGNMMTPALPAALEESRIAVD